MPVKRLWQHPLINWRLFVTDVADVGQSSVEINESSSQVDTSAEPLSELADKLENMVGRFQV